MGTDYQVEKNEVIYFYFSLKMIYAYIRVSTDKQTKKTSAMKLKNLPKTVNLRSVNG
jgi:hypothetical protein